MRRNVKIEKVILHISPFSIIVERTKSCRSSPAPDTTPPDLIKTFGILFPQKRTHFQNKKMANFLMLRIAYWRTVVRKYPLKTDHFHFLVRFRKTHRTAGGQR